MRSWYALLKLIVCAAAMRSKNWLYAQQVCAVEIDCMRSKNWLYAQLVCAIKLGEHSVILDSRKRSFRAHLNAWIIIRSVSKTKQMASFDANEYGRVVANAVASFLNPSPSASQPGGDVSTNTSQSSGNRLQQNTARSAQVFTRSNTCQTTRIRRFVS